MILGGSEIVIRDYLPRNQIILSQGSIFVHPLMALQLKFAGDPHTQIAEITDWLLDDAYTKFYRAAKALGEEA